MSIICALQIIFHKDGDSVHLQFSGQLLLNLEPLFFVTELGWIGGVGGTVGTGSQ